jgi:hypothetical protein
MMNNETPTTAIASHEETPETIAQCLTKTAKSFTNDMFTHTREGLLRPAQDTPKENDVLLGRGRCFHLRKGNVEFRGNI